MTRPTVATALLAACALLAPQAAQASTVTFQGYLNDPSNPNLVFSDLGPPSFVDDFDIADNVALYTLTVPIGGPVTFDSNGFDAGGADPYFSLFDSSGAFLVSAFGPIGPGDFLITPTLAAGIYRVAIGVWSNESFAENSGGSLADGFIRLGEPDSLGIANPAYYELAVTLGPAAVAEPSTLLLLLTGTAIIVGWRQSRG